MKKLYVSADRVFLYLIKSRLEKQGIPSFIKNEDVAGQAAGELPPAVVTPELWVLHDQDYDAAHALLQEELLRRHQHRSDWLCPTCKERLEGQFDVCWKCGDKR